MNRKMTTSSELSTTKPKTNKQTKNKQSKQPEQEQNHRNGDHMEVISREGEERDWGERYRE